MALELHRSDERLIGAHRAALATLLLVACSPSTPAGGGRQASPGPTAAKSVEPKAPEAPSPDVATKPDSQDPALAPERVVFPGKAACPGGLDVPEFDPTKAPWWDKLTRDQRVAFVESRAYERWSAVTGSPIALHQAKSGLVLRSVDGCWRQELSSESGVDRIDGLSGVVWDWHPEGVRLVDLWRPGAAVPILDGPLEAEDFAVVGEDGSVLLQWSDFKPGTPRSGARRAKLQWSAAPRFEPARAKDAGPSLAPEGERWLAERLDRQARGPRVTRIRLASAAGAPAESRCTDPAVCRNAAPFGSSNLEYVYYAENENTLEEYEGGPVCALFDPSSGEWYQDPTRTVKGADPRQFDVHEALCQAWQFDLTGRAYLRDGEVCVAAKCVRADGEPLGFVRGDVFIFPG